jgi:MYXO-CTERM domain-containing protein
LNAACEFEGNCFDATFQEDGIFQRTGTFFASDGDAKIVISGSPTTTPVPALSTWAMLAVGLAGLAFARNRRIRGGMRLTPGIRQ